MAPTYRQYYEEEVEKIILESISRLDAPDELKESMSYSIKAGGKRFRPALVFAVLEDFSVPLEQGLKTAAAVEMIHTYSLIHDDLPSMDNDTLRRGQPTNHVVFGEAMAILSGDALLTQAFSLICNDAALAPSTRLKIIHLLSEAAGPSGMIAGQVRDMAAEKTPVDFKGLKKIHHDKTGRLIEFCVTAGAIIAGVDELSLADLQTYSRHLGLAFQIKDDILDIEGTAEVLGKTPGKDMANQKSTYTSLLGLDRAKVFLEEELNASLMSLNETRGSGVNKLASLIDLIRERKN